MEKLKALFQSRKFWALVSSIVAVGVGVYNGAINPADAVQLIVAALAAYSIGTGLDQGNPEPLG